MYTNELKAIHKSNRYRKREIFDNNIIDLASNDYLGLSTNKNLLEKSYDKISNHKSNSSKASTIINGYTKIHQDFENELKKINQFEDCIIVSNGFTANISLIDTLVRKKDIIIIDEYYHASGILATKLIKNSQVIYFKHNDHKDLEKILIELKYKNISRIIIAIEGIYSMTGTIAKKEIFDLVEEYNTILIVDEAHSCGVLGDNLLGIFDYYKIIPNKKHIKMGTLGKAYASFGAYILASYEIIDFLINKAKPIIYSTAPSLFDTQLGFESFKHINKTKNKLKIKINSHLKIINKYLKIDSKSLIVPITINDNNKALQIQQELKSNNFLIGAIRTPTVNNAIIRVILRLEVSSKDLIKFCKTLNEILLKYNIK